MKLTVGHDVTWQSAFLVTRAARRIAIVGGPEGALIRQAGLYPTIITYDEDFAPALTRTLAELDPGQIAINYSGDVAADGLTHGMYLQLTEALANSPYLERLISAGPVVGALRAVRRLLQLERMSKAIEIDRGALSARSPPFSVRVGPRLR